MDMAFVVNILCQMHISQTSLEKPPFSYDVSFDSLHFFDIEKYELLKTNSIEMDKFVDKTIKIFLNKYPLSKVPYGSVHCSPKSFCIFALESIKKTFDEGLNKIIFPNGCCSRGIECPINKYYEVVLEVFLSK
jgi:hypothetical protein